jgi:hypothetical protein
MTGRRIKTTGKRTETTSSRTKTTNHRNTTQTPSPLVIALEHLSVIETGSFKSRGQNGVTSGPKWGQKGVILGSFWGHFY